MSHLRVLFAIMLVGVVVFAVPVQAAAEPAFAGTIVETSRQTIFASNSCGDAGDDLLLVEATFHSMFHQTLTGSHFLYNGVSFIHMAGISLATGARYVGSEGPFRQYGFFDLEDGSFVQAFGATWVMNRVGGRDLPADDLRLHAILRWTVDSNGQMTTTVDNQRIECT